MSLLNDSLDEIGALKEENAELRKALAWALAHAKGKPTRRIPGQNDAYFDAWTKAAGLAGTE